MYEKDNPMTNHYCTRQEQLKKIKIAKDSPPTLEISFLLPQFLRKLDSKSTYTNIFVCFNNFYKRLNWSKQPSIESLLARGISVWFKWSTSSIKLSSGRESSSMALRWYFITCSAIEAKHKAPSVVQNTGNQVLQVSEGYY